MVHSLLFQLRSQIKLFVFAMPSDFWLVALYFSMNYEHYMQNIATCKHFMHAESKKER
nr:hypothetical protein VCHA53O474_30525 [Vibrio chagasii]